MDEAARLWNRTVVEECLRVWSQSGGRWKTPLDSAMQEARQTGRSVSADTDGMQPEGNAG